MKNRTTNKHLGSISEKVATVWLMRQGLEVFENVSTHGEVDLITRNPSTGEIRSYDVTTGKIYIKLDGSKSFIYSKEKDRKVGIYTIVILMMELFSFRSKASD